MSDGENVFSLSFETKNRPKPETIYLIPFSNLYQVEPGDDTVTVRPGDIITLDGSRLPRSKEKSFVRRTVNKSDTE